jgi:hypothetical protein
MTTYDVTPDDDPLDVAAVSSDDALVEQLRHALSPDAAVVWDDEDDDVDPALALLRALQVDVSAGVAAHSNTMLPTGVAELLPRRRHLGRGATIAVVAASVLSVAGVAAASAPGQPLAGVRHAVSAAVSHAVDALTPDSQVGPAVEATESPSAKPTPPGDAVSAAERSASAVRQIEDNLDRAAALIDDGRYQPAKNQLNAAASKLRYVTDAGVKAGLQSRLTALQSRLAAMPTAKPTPGTSDDKTNHGQDPTKDATKGGNSGNSGNSGKGGNGDNVTHSPKAEPTHKPRVEPTKTPHGHGSDDATPDEISTPDPSDN